MIHFYLDESAECSCSSQCYSFTRPRNDGEWDILRSYTRRVWRIVGFSSSKGSLNPRCISAAFSPPPEDPLFPNLRFLIWQGGTSTLPAIHFASPLLTYLDIRNAPREDVSVYTNLLNTLVPRCPNIRNIRIQVAHNVEFGEAVHRHLCSLNKLRIVDCLDVPISVDVIPHLSSVSTLSWLSFTLNTETPDPIPPPSSALVFSQLVYLEIVSEFLESVTCLITHIRLPAVQVLIMPFPTCPSNSTVKSYLTTLQKTCSSNTLTDLRLLNLRSFLAYIPGFIDHTPHNHRLNFDDIRPCMAFSNLRAIHINLEWSVDLTDGDLLKLVSAWPNIEHLVINDHWGWRTTNGITLDGLVQILQSCVFLWDLCIAINVESATEISQHLDDINFSPRDQFQLNVADSPIQAEFVPALGTIFSFLGFSCDNFSSWNGSEVRNLAESQSFRTLWGNVFD